MIVEARVANPISIFRTATAGDGDKSHAVQSGNRTQALQQFVVVYFGQANVDQCGIRIERLHLCQRLSRRFHRRHFMAIETQEFGQAFDRVLVVIDDENAPGRHGFRFRLPGNGSFRLDTRQSDREGRAPYRGPGYA